MKKQKLTNFLNEYFKKFGVKNIIDEYSIDHDIDIYVHDINRNDKGQIQIFLDSDPERLEHTIEDYEGDSITFKDAVWYELKTALSYIGIDIYDIKFFFNKRSLETYLPFDETEISENVKVRTFNDTTNSDEFKWHRDREDRTVEVLESKNWYLQMDNEIPKKLIKGKKYYIPEGEYHRVIKGDGNLVVKIVLNNILK